MSASADRGRRLFNKIRKSGSWWCDMYNMKNILIVLYREFIFLDSCVFNISRQLRRLFQSFAFSADFKRYCHFLTSSIQHSLHPAQFLCYIHFLLQLGFCSEADPSPEVSFSHTTSVCLFGIVII